MEPCSYRTARESDREILRSELGEEAKGLLSRLLEFACTRPEWILLDFVDGALAGALALAAPSEFNRPIEIFRLYGRLEAKINSTRLFQRAIELARTLGVRELYCALPEDSADASLLSEMGFCRWRKVVRFASPGPVDLGARGYRSTEVGNFPRAKIIALINKTSEQCLDSQIEFYRRRLGPAADAEMTLQMMESTKYDPRWWRVVFAPDGNAVGIIFLVVAFGEPTVGFIGVIPEYRGRNISSFLLAEAWSVMKHQGHSTLCAEADERSVSMHRALQKSQFSRQSQKQEWRLEL
jgi:GNAT superfamily N-acetyltransferase/N-acetylglutamate synthase-like GNAT family acetyltransferase